MNLPEPIRRLAEHLQELPGIGPRQAIRTAFYLVGRGKNEIGGLAASINDLARLKICGNCFFPTPGSGLRLPQDVGVTQSAHALCDICRDPKRKKSTVAIVEKETDFISIENTKKFSGRYLILGPIPKTGMLLDSQKLRLQNLKTYIQKELGGRAEEIVLALNPTANGDFHASLIMKELIPFTQKITRLGRGLPIGGEIEFADDETLGSALELRR